MFFICSYDFLLSDVKLVTLMLFLLNLESTQDGVKFAQLKCFLMSLFSLFPVVAVLSLLMMHTIGEWRHCHWCNWFALFSQMTFGCVLALHHILEMESSIKCQDFLTGHVNIFVKAMAKS